MTDRRHNHWVKDLAIPLIVAVVVGVSAAMVTVRIAVAVIETELVGVKEDVIDLKNILQVVQENQIAKTRLELIAKDNMAEVLNIWTEINTIKANRYTENDALRDIQMLRLEMKALHGIPPTTALKNKGDE
jgi:hypothetical protein